MFAGIHLDGITRGRLSRALAETHEKSKDSGVRASVIGRLVNHSPQCAGEAALDDRSRAWWER
jgi:hypothetical protein